ncbi:hypothetical protein ACL9RL_18405 [Plantibacter sp. Mn2098]|uniref:hypothetical protein n=1 Tax=Plantibacter sp. Mn2098 TaxID=3395266 RepID=UPI003BD3A7A4
MGKSIDDVLKEFDRAGETNSYQWWWLLAIAPALVAAAAMKFAGPVTKETAPSVAVGFPAILAAIGAVAVVIALVMRSLDTAPKQKSDVIAKAQTYIQHSVPKSPDDPEVKSDNASNNANDDLAVVQFVGFVEEKIEEINRLKKTQDRNRLFRILFEWTGAVSLAVSAVLVVYFWNLTR